MTSHQNHIIKYIVNILYNNIRMRWKWQGAKGGSTRDGGVCKTRIGGFYSTRLNSVSSQCARALTHWDETEFSSTTYCNAWSLSNIFNIFAFGFSYLIITYTLGCLYTQKYISYYILMFLKEHPIMFLSKIVISTRHIYTYKCGGEPATYREGI